MSDGASDAAAAALAVLSAPELLAAYPEISSFVEFVTPRLAQVETQRTSLEAFRSYVVAHVERGEEQATDGASAPHLAAFDARDLARVDAELTAVRAEAALLQESLESQLRLSVGTIEVLERVVQERSAAVAALEDLAHGAVLSSRPGFAAYWTGTADRLEATLTALRRDAAASTGAVIEEVERLRGGRVVAPAGNPV